MTSKCTVSFDDDDNLVIEFDCDDANHYSLLGGMAAQFPSGTLEWEEDGTIRRYTLRSQHLA